jgi:hypothetical protein
MKIRELNILPERKKIIHLGGYVSEAQRYENALCYGFNEALYIIGNIDFKQINLKDKNILNDFINYCMFNPKQRFWQALRNWSGFNFVWVSMSNGLDNSNIKDTFYFIDKDK